MSATLAQLLHPIFAQLFGLKLPSTQSTLAAVQQNDNVLYFYLVGMVIMLIFVSLILLFIIGLLYTAIKAKVEGEDYKPTSPWFLIKLLIRNKYVSTLVVGVLAIYIGLEFIEFARNDVGLHQGYAPVQPVQYSHKLHAGAVEDGGLAIECEYCHTGVLRGKSATIPGANICMNCHVENGINGESEYSQNEILKVRNAYNEGRRIEWVRIHNLPDLVYFNHQQHYVVGGIACQTCHGPIETMEVVYQYQDLSMGWCINCHRETEVAGLKQGNDYYVRVHNEYIERAKQDGSTEIKVTVAELGGLSCAKCHY